MVTVAELLDFPRAERLKRMDAEHEGTSQSRLASRPPISVYQVWQWTTSASIVSLAIASERWNASSTPANRGSVFSLASAQGG